MKHTVMLAMLLSLAAPLAAQEEAAAEDPWKGSLGLSWLSTSGNSDTSSFGIDFTVEREPDPWGLKAFATAIRSEEDGVTNAERYTAGARAERALSERWLVFAGLSGEKDEFAGYELRGIVETGVTYTALAGPSHHLELDAGLTWTREDLVEGDDQDFLGALLGLDYEWKLSDTASLTESLRFFPNFDEGDAWRLTSDTALKASVNEWLAVKLGYLVRYENEPVPGFEDTDTTTTASLVVSF